MNPQLLDSGCDLIGIHSQFCLQSRSRDRLRTECSVHRFQDRLIRIVALEEVLVRTPIGPALQQDRPGRSTVTTGAADLLIVALDAAGHSRMHNRPHVGFVYSHAESNGGHDDLDLAA